jgi:Mitochondrial pyruvate carriers
MIHSSVSLNRLAAVNFCLAIVGTVQVTRILSYRSSAEGSKMMALEASKEEEKRAAMGVKEEVKKVVS